MDKRIYKFGADVTEGSAGMKALLGGKGANLAEMAALGLPVPPGFTITTLVCKAYQKTESKTAFIDALMKEVEAYDSWLAGVFGYYPLLSVRSGAPVSMPGMMDTILNVGLAPGNMDLWEGRLGPRAALDSYRRLIQMMGATAYGVPAEVFEFQLALTKKKAGVKADTDLDVVALSKVVARYKAAFEANVKKPFPDLRSVQLRAAIVAVFNSWMNPRAIEYRKINHIDESMGTAVNVQAMVFGNTGENSGTGVLFSRDPATGEKKVLGEFLRNAQGEDVVAGIRTPQPLDEMAKLWPDLHEQLMAHMHDLEQHFHDMQDMEFTIQDGALWVLQCRVGKRTAIAAFRMASQMVDEGLIDRPTALKRLSRGQYKVVSRPSVSNSFKALPNMVGKPASPGVAVGIPVFTAADAVNCKSPCILVTHETNPDDIAGMAAAAGVLTQTGGVTSHAAVVARSLDKPCVVGCTDLDLEALKQVGPGFRVTIDGATGRVWLGVEVPVEDGASDPDVRRVCRWAMEAAKRPIAGLGGELGPDWFGPVVIMAADFWDEKEKMLKLLANLAAVEDLSNVSLDLTSPVVFAAPQDDVLRCAFGTKEEGFELSNFQPWLLQVLVSRTDLQGLLVTGNGLSSSTLSSLKKAGYRVATAPTTVGEMLDADMVTLSEGFVKNVMGGPAAVDELLGLMEKAGKKVGLVVSPVPAEYAVFTQLGG